MVGLSGIRIRVLQNNMRSIYNKLVQSEDYLYMKYVANLHDFSIRSYDNFGHVYYHVMNDMSTLNVKHMDIYGE